VPNQNSDDLFRQIASDYVDAWGKSLQEEQKELEQDSALALHPRMDRKVLGQVAARKRRRTAGALGAVAACLALAILLPRASNMGMGSTSQYAASSTEQKAAEIARVPEALPDDQAFALAEPEEDRLDAQALPESTLEKESPAESAPLPEQGNGVIPLPFTLPEHLTILSAEREGEKSVYHLESSSSDPIVLTLESTSRFPDTEGLTPVDIDGQTVYTASRPEEQFLTFQKDGILYEMTCPSDLEALIALSRAILQA